jgi:hypothetical protein
MNQRLINSLLDVFCFLHPIWRSEVHLSADGRYSAISRSALVAFLNWSCEIGVSQTDVAGQHLRHVLDNVAEDAVIPIA